MSQKPMRPYHFMTISEIISECSLLGNNFFASDDIVPLQVIVCGKYFATYEITAVDRETYEKGDTLGRYIVHEARYTNNNETIEIVPPSPFTYDECRFQSLADAVVFLRKLQEDETSVLSDTLNKQRERLNTLVDENARLLKECNELRNDLIQLQVENINHQIKHKRN